MLSHTRKIGASEIETPALLASYRISDVGIGSLAPLARNGSKRTVIDIICTVRQLLPEALSYLDYLEDRDGKNHIHRRACHNLYAFNFEANRVREEKKLNTLETFIECRMKSTVYQKIFQYATKKAQS